MNESDTKLLERVAALLDSLPSAPDSTRVDKWRTTDQIANELQLFGWEAVDRLERLLRKHEAQGLELMKNGAEPNRMIRRAKYPDRTTALPLWGSTRNLGQPWSGHRPDRSDPPQDSSARLVVPPESPHVFLSHTHDDAFIALGVAEELAAMTIGSWRFETDIEQRGDIADCVRGAIAEADALVAFVSRSSIASLWVLTELHSALAANKTVILVVDANDPVLLRLLETAHFHNPDCDFDMSVEYDRGTVQLLKQDYSRRQTRGRTDRYEAQVHDFMATLPRYLGSVLPGRRRVWRSALAYPQRPAHWSGFLALDSLRDLPKRLESLRDY
jgi:hypothetical protein